MNRLDALLSDARQARLDHAPKRVLQTLDLARTVAASEALGRQTSTGWRYAKAAYDFGTAGQVLDALTQIVALPDPFFEYPQGLRAVAPTSQRVWDHLGFHPVVLQLWRAYSQAQQAAGDPYLAAMGEVHQAWHLVCAGDLDGAWQVARRYANLSARRFGRGPTKHPEAEDATLSLYWVQADLARTVLRGATWARRERLAKEALDLYDDAMALANLDRHKRFWYVDPVCRAADRFGWKVPAFAAWPRLLSAIEHVHPVHFLLGRAVITRRMARAERAHDLFLQAQALADQTHAGFEWQVDALIEASAGRADGHQWINRARRIASDAKITGFAF